MEFSMPMSTVDIQRCIPHRYPFLLIDRVIEHEVGKRIVAVKCLSINEPFLQGHFPGNPILPGVLILEGMAQAAGVMAKLATNGDETSFLFTGVDSARFRKQVVPGHVVKYEVNCVRRKAGFFWFEATCFLDDEVASEACFSAKLS